MDTFPLDDVYLALCPNTELDQRSIELGVKDKKAVLLLEIVPFHPNFQSPFGLIVVPVKGPNHEYTRIGVLVFKGPPHMLNESHLRSKARESLFAGFQSQAIKLL